MEHTKKLQLSSITLIVIQFGKHYSGEYFQYSVREISMRKRQVFSEGNFIFRIFNRYLVAYKRVECFQNLILQLLYDTHAHIHIYRESVENLR